MDFQNRTLKTPHKQRIVIEIDILGEEIDLNKVRFVRSKPRNRGMSDICRVIP